MDLSVNPSTVGECSEATKSRTTTLIPQPSAPDHSESGLKASPSNDRASRQTGREQQGMSVLRSWLLRACVACLCACGTAQQTPVQTPTTSPETPSQISSSRFLVIEAEDLGMAHSIDKASFAAFENGWVTSAGVLAPAPWFPEVVRWARTHPNSDLGLQKKTATSFPVRQPPSPGTC